MNEVLVDLIVAVPTAVAVIVVVILFLRNQREERQSRDFAQSKFLNALSKLSEPITELIVEVKLLREQHTKMARRTADGQ